MAELSLGIAETLRLLFMSSSRAVRIVRSIRDFTCTSTNKHYGFDR